MKYHFSPILFYSLFLYLSCYSNAHAFLFKIFAIEHFNKIEDVEILKKQLKTKLEIPDELFEIELVEQCENLKFKEYDTLMAICLNKEKKMEIIYQKENIIKETLRPFKK